jgi:hypothetical protein
MTDYFLDDAANGTNDGLAWETCYNTWAQVASAGILASPSNRLFVGADANITNPGAALTITGPTAGVPVPIISSTVGSGAAVSYSPSTSDQAVTTGGAYDITFDGSFALYGICAKAGRDVVLPADNNEFLFTRDCTFRPAAGRSVSYGQDQSNAEFENLTIDLAADGSNSTTVPLAFSGSGVLYGRGLRFLSAAFRTNAILNPNARGTHIAGIDVSDFSNGTLCELLNIADIAGSHVLTNIRTYSTWGPYTGVPRSGFTMTIINAGPDDDPTYLFHKDSRGELTSTTTIYRNSGATIEGTAVAWRLTVDLATDLVSEATPFYTPWIYGVIDSTGSKTFSMAIVNDGAALTDAEAWIEVQYFATADKPEWTLASDQRVITATPAAQTTDGTSTWTDADGSISPSFTHKQTLSKQVTVNETGQYRARVAIGKVIAAADYLFVDPKVIVT